MSTDQLPGLQMAVKLLAQIGDDDSDAAIAAVHDLAEAHAQRLTLQHHAADQVWRIADLERHISSLISESEAKIPAMQAAFEERLTLDRANRMLVAKNAELEAERNERDELRARLAEMNSCYAHDAVWEALQRMIEDGQTKGPASREDALTVARHRDRVRLLAASPVPAQAVPDADGARFRWLCEDHSDRETRERCRSLIDRLSVMSYSDAVMSIDAAMAAAPEHKA